MAAQYITINLLPKTIQGERFGGRFLQWALTYGRYIIIVTELIVLMAFFSRFFFDQQLADLHEIIKHKQAVIASVSVADFERDVRALQDRIVKIGALEKQHALYPEVIATLNETIPEDIILSALTIKENAVTLRVIAHSKKGLAELLESLKKSPRFRSINVGTIEPADKTVGALSLQISLEIVPPAE